MEKLNIIQDTREQKGLFITEPHITFEEYKKKHSTNHQEWLQHINKNNKNKEYELATLKIGDYTLKEYENLIAIERKGPMDAFTTLGRKKNHERFNQECEKAKTLKYFAVIIELNITNIQNKNFPNSFRTKLKGPQILQTWITHSMKRNYHIFFVNNTQEAKTLTKYLLKTFKTHYTPEQ
jgi:hypothetical protein